MGQEQIYGRQWRISTSSCNEGKLTYDLWLPGEHSVNNNDGCSWVSIFQNDNINASTCHFSIIWRAVLPNVDKAVNRISNYPELLLQMCLAEKPRYVRNCAKVDRIVCERATYQSPFPYTLCQSPSVIVFIYELLGIWRYSAVIFLFTSVLCETDLTTKSSPYPPLAASPLQPSWTSHTLGHLSLTAVQSQAQNC